uniref:Chitinase 6-2 n=1 Tax=Plutella xylostella TaxID=51655 RepID=A0A3Q9JP63_PLUXY|nr:chitinase 6-2 [Plutella xylostella]
MGSSERRKSLINMDHAAIWLTIALAVITFTTPASSSEPRVVCYYTNWSVYRPGTARFNPQNINPYLCTHLIYAFGGFTKDNAFKPFDKYQDIEKGGYAKFTGLKTYNKNLKTLLAIGGWNEGSSRFSPMVASRERRKEFVRNAIKFLRQNRFDGLDLDWEYPAFRDGGKPKDRENYAKLVKELREEFEKESEKTGKPRLLLTMAVPAGIEYIQKGFDVKTLNQYLDWMNLLTYDYHSAFEPAVNHHAPLYPLEEPNEYSVDNELNIDYTIKFYLENGADRDKLVLGIPTYGRSYSLFNPDATEIGAPADGPGEQGDATREKGYLAYYEICESLKPKSRKREVDSDDESEDEDSDDEDLPWTVVQPNPKAMGPYAYRGNQWVGYDDIDIVSKKAEYVAENGLGGIMFWSIDNDDFRGTCHGKPYPLIEAAKEAYISRLGSTDNAVAVTERARVTSSSSRRRNRPRPSSSTARPTAATKLSSSTKRKSAASSTTPAWSISTPEPPTTPDPGSDFKCTDEGFFPHPRDCKKYFWCLDSGPSNLGIVAHQFTCPSGLFFNKAADSCDFARNVLCKKPSTTTTTKAPPKTTTAKPQTTTRAPTTTEAATTTRRAIKLSTKNSALFRTTSTTTTTTAAPEEIYDDSEDEAADIDAEDPKVIKELIDLIKKVGGVEQLEKHLHLAESSAAAAADGPTTTASPYHKKLYQKVLERTRSNKNIGGGVGEGLVSYSRRGPQNAGLETDSDSDSEQRTPKRDGRPQYTTINRSRGSTTEEPSDSVEAPAVPEVSNRARAVDDSRSTSNRVDDSRTTGNKVDDSRTSNKDDSRSSGDSRSTTSRPLQYVNIRRARPTDTADDTASRNALFERSEPYVTVSESNSLDIASARRENIPEYVTIRRSRHTTEEATTAQYTITEESSYETLLEKEISSPLQPQYTSIERKRPSTPPPTEPDTPEPTTVLAVQISSLLNAPNPEDEEELIQTEAAPEETEAPTTVTTPAPSTLPPRRAPPRRRGTTTPAPVTSTVSTTTQAQKDRRNNFLRRTKATAPPDSTDPATEVPDTTAPTQRYTRRGNSKFKTNPGRKDAKKETKEEKEPAGKDGGKIEIRTRPPSLNSATRSAPARGFARRRLGGANATSTTPAPSSTSSSSSSATTRRPFRVASRRRPVATTAATSTTAETKATTAETKATSAVTTGTTVEERAETKGPTTPATTTLASEEVLQDIEERDSIEDPSLAPRNIQQTIKKTVKTQRRPLTSLREPVDLNLSATSEDRKGQTKDPPTKEDDRKRQSKKYSSSFKQNQLDEVIRLKTKSQEEFDAATQSTTENDNSAETAVAIAAHQLLSAPLPADSFAEQAKTSFKKTSQKSFYPTTKSFSYTSTVDFDTDHDSSSRLSEGFTTPSPIYRGPSFSSIANREYSSSPGYSTTVIPISGYSSGLSKTSGYSSTPSYSSTSRLPYPTAQRPSGFTTAGFLSGGFSISPALGPSTARFLDTSNKYEPAPIDDFGGYTSGDNPEPAYFTREYLLESPVTKTYDDQYQYLSPARTEPSTTRKLPKKTVFRRISTTLGPTAAALVTTAKPRRAPQRKPFEKISKAVVDVPGRTYRPIDNYDYYDDSDEKLATNKQASKVIVHGKGSIECLDIGNFPHPTSCKKFISCARMESGATVGWEYVCPKGLSFDPVGGICNWSAGLGCNEN